MQLLVMTAGRWNTGHVQERTLHCELAVVRPEYVVVGHQLAQQSAVTL